jgi:hypothetical protein
MPRNPGTGQYSKPIPDAIPNTTIASAPYNSNVDDVVIDLNSPRPIVAGGTGATNAHDAMVSLGGELALQSITNYAAPALVSGSFFSNNGATGAPNGNAFVGPVYVHANPQYAVMEAYDVNTVTATPTKYVRMFQAGIWGAWLAQPTAADVNAKVNRTGDTMTGGLALTNGTVDSPEIQFQTAGFSPWNIDSNSGALRFFNGGQVTIQIDSARQTQITGPLLLTGAGTSISLRKNASGQVNDISGWTGAVPRWLLRLGNDTVESGGNAGSDFSVVRYSDAGSVISSPLAIRRQTGNVLLDSSAFVNDSFGFLFNRGQNACLWVDYSGPGQDFGIMIGNRTAGAAFAVGILSNANTIVGSINHNGTTTSFTTSSSADLKEDLKTFDAGNIIDGTNVYDFKWKSSQERAYGILAQQAVEVYPAAVTHDEKNDWYGIDYSKYVPVLLQELKALRARVAQLEAGAAGKPVS